LYQPQEEQSPIDESEHVRKLCDELRAGTLGSKDISKTLRDWLLDMVRAMRDGIDRYQIRGARGLRQRLHEVLGSLMLNWKLAEEVKKKAPTIWTRFIGGIEVVEKVSRFAEHSTKMLGAVMKAIEHFGGTSTPSLPSE
jgi:hypothetical protein